MMASYNTDILCVSDNDDGVQSSDSSDEIEMVLPSLESSKKKPTEQFDLYWIQARNKTSKNSLTPEENCGKWLIFEPIDKIDQVWATIQQETETGELGFASKVSTMKDKDEKDKNFVICVYTYDHTDEADVMRVRQRLKELGFIKKLPYKTDAATNAGHYRSTTGGRVSKYYC